MFRERSENFDRLGRTYVSAKYCRHSRESGNPDRRAERGQDPYAGRCALLDSHRAIAARKRAEAREWRQRQQASQSMPFC